MRRPTRSGTTSLALWCVVLATMAVLAPMKAGRGRWEREPTDWAARFVAERADAARSASHRPQLDGETPIFPASNARIGRDGLDGPSAHGAVSLGLAAFGREGAMHVAARGEPEIHGPEVRATRGPHVLEWWRSLSSGLEHGVTLEERAAGGGALVLELATGVDTRVVQVGDDELSLRDEATGAERARYAHLVVVDAGGARVPGRLVADGARIRIEVDDECARYPLVVDPLLYLVLEATLPAPGATTVASSRLGDRVIVGAPGDDTAAGIDAGRARVFRRTGTAWAEEAQLEPAAALAGGMFGRAVALSADATRAAILGADSVVLFARSGAVWTEQSTLAAVASSRAFALSADGARIVVGHPVLDPDFYAWTGAAWTPETFSPPPAGINAGFADRVAFSPDGMRVLFGDGRMVGAWVFVRVGSSWTPEAELDATSGLPGETAVREAALSADRAFVGLSSSTLVFLRSGTSWAREAVLPCGSLFTTEVSDDGTVLVTGGCAFVRSGVTWTQFASVTGGQAAVSGDGTRLAVAAPASGEVAVYRVTPTSTDGTACSIDDECLAGRCVDGVCCDTACAGLCESCRGAETGGTDGACRPVTAATDPASECTLDGATCRGETCNGARACAPAPDGTECRASGSVCDVAEACVGGTCPSDAFASAGTICRGAADVCDATETCDGASSACPPDRLLSGVECRAAAGACDVAESCFGTSPSCPPDVLLASGVACRVASDPSCDPVEACDGVSVGCPADVTTCAPGPDGAASVDAGSPVAASAGCACRLAVRRTRAPWTVLATGVVLLGRRRRRRSFTRFVRPAAPGTVTR